MNEDSPVRNKVFKTSDRLGYFSLVLLIIGIVGLVTMVRQLWYGNEVLVLVTIIPLALAYPLYKLSQRKEKEAERRRQEILNKGYAKG